MAPDKPDILTWLESHGRLRDRDGHITSFKPIPIQERLLAKFAGKLSPPCVLKNHPCLHPEGYTFHVRDPKCYQPSGLTMLDIWMATEPEWFVNLMRLQTCRALRRIIGSRPISRQDALRIADEQLERAERERREVADAEARRGVQYPDED